MNWIGQIGKKILCWILGHKWYVYDSPIPTKFRVWIIEINKEIITEGYVQRLVCKRCRTIEDVPVDIFNEATYTDN